MKKLVLCIFYVILFLGNGISQPFVSVQGVNVTHVKVRGNPVALDSVEVTVDTIGIAIVRFTGTCISSQGDLIIVAASDNVGWQNDDGNVRVKSYSTSQDRNSFSHTRAYNLKPGTYKFYAVAENYLEQDGDGIISVYGHLSVQFYPAANGMSTAFIVPVAQSSVQLKDSMVILGQLDLNLPEDGNVLLRFDGYCSGIYGDHILFAANDTPSTMINDGHVSVLPPNDKYPVMQFSHTRLFNVLKGKQSFYAVGISYGDTNSLGITDIFGTLTAIYFPAKVPGQPYMEGVGINATRENMRGGPVTLASIVAFPSTFGTVLLNFDGYLSADYRDRIILAATNNGTWGVNEGAASVQTLDLTVKRASFAHEMADSVQKGEYGFSAVGENYVITGGNGIASVYGILTLQFFPVTIVSTKDPGRQIMHDFELSQNYPNPFNPSTIIQYTLNQQVQVELIITDIQGSTVYKQNFGFQPPGTYTIQWNAENQPAGIYFYTIQAGPHKMTRKMILIK